MHAGAQGQHGLVHEGAQAVPAALVAGRDDFHPGKDLVPAGVADDHGLGLGRVDVQLGPRPEVRLGRGRGQGEGARRAGVRRPTLRRPFPRQRVGAQPPGDLLGQGVVIGRQEPAFKARATSVIQS
jgi:hypothetical protein